MSHAHANDIPAPAAAPFTAAMTGFSSRADRVDVRVVGRAQPVADVAGRLAELGEVLADAEAAAGAGDHDGADLVVARVLQRGVQRLVHRAVERVEHVGPVQRDRQDRAVALRLDLCHERDVYYRSRKPVPSSSASSSTKRCSPVRCALPSTSVITAGVPAIRSPTTRARNSLPTMLRCRSSSPRGELAARVEQRKPRGRAAAARRAVDLAVGEDGDVALRVRALALPEDHAVDVAQLGLERMDDLVLATRARA